MALRWLAFVLFLAGCAPSQRWQPTASAPERVDERLPFGSVDRLLESLPSTSLRAAVEAFERRARRVIASCESARVERAATTVAIHAGVGCASLRGSVAVAFTERRGELRLHVVFDHWSIDHGDVLHGVWRTLPRTGALSSDSLSQRADENLPFAEQAGANSSATTPWPPAESMAERCIDQFVTRTRLIAKGVSALSALSVIGLPLTALAAVHTAVTCR